MHILYGIKSCDTVKKARQWLERHGIEYRLHDFRVDGLEPELLDRLEMAVGWEKLLNRRGTSWRKLSETERDGVDCEKALALMLSYPTLIKRPVLETGTKILVGFTAEAYADEL